MTETSPKPDVNKDFQAAREYPADPGCLVQLGILPENFKTPVQALPALGKH